MSDIVAEDFALVFLENGVSVVVVDGDGPENTREIYSEGDCGEQGFSGFVEGVGGDDVGVGCAE